MNKESLTPVITTESMLEKKHTNSQMRVKRFSRAALSNQGEVDLGAFLAAAEEKDRQEELKGQIKKISAGREIEINAESLNGKIGMGVIAINEKGDRYVYTNENAKECFEPLKDFLRSKDLKKYRLERAFIVAPENSPGKVRDVDLVERINDTIKYEDIIKRYASKEDPESYLIPQVHTYSDTDMFNSYLDSSFSIKFDKNGTSTVYVGSEVLDPEL